MPEIGRDRETSLRETIHREARRRGAGAAQLVDRYGQTSRQTGDDGAHPVAARRLGRWRWIGPGRLYFEVELAEGEELGTNTLWAIFISVYPVQARIRNFVGLMTRKLSVT